MAYTTAEYKSADEPFDDGSVRVTLELTGAGEKPKTINYVLSAIDTVETVRTWVDHQAVKIAPVKTILSQFTPGQKFAVRAIVPPVAQVPTPEQVWRAKVSRYLAAKDLALTNATAVSDRNALFADINSTYLTAYL